MHRSMRMAAGLLALSLAAGGCYGPFNATRRLAQWNDQVGRDKWQDEFLFLILNWAPAYGLAVLSDALLFNTLQFWTGSNPVDPPQRAAREPRTTLIARGEDAVMLTYVQSAEGPELLVQAFHGTAPAVSLRLRCLGDRSVALDGPGQVVLAAQTQPDGTVVVSDAQGRLVASYSGEQVKQFARSVLR